MDCKFYPGQLKGCVPAVPSKSEAHRRLICAGLTQGETELTGWADSADMAATINCLKALGAHFRQNGETMLVTGSAGKPLGFPRMDCGESGSTLRFFVPIAMALTGGGIFVMHGRLSQRPMDVYRDLFVPKGAAWHMGIGPDGAAELEVRGSLQAGDYILPGNVSSQFISGLLLALPLLEGESTLTVKGSVESAGYIAMTLEALRESGIRLEALGRYSWRIPGGQAYHALPGRLHGDWSQAAVPLAAAAINGDVTVTGLSLTSTQGDRAIVDLLLKLGANVTAEGDQITVQAGRLQGATLDLRDCPDIAPILALVCQMAEGDSRLKNCGRLRIKECDRLTKTAEMLNQLGGQAVIEGDDLLIHGVSKLHGGAVDTANDHRMVMLASVAALCADAPVEVTGAEALNKSWPGYLDCYRQLGGNYT